MNNRNTLLKYRYEYSPFGYSYLQEKCSYFFKKFEKIRAFFLFNQNFKNLIETRIKLKNFTKNTVESATLNLTFFKLDL